MHALQIETLENPSEQTFRSRFYETRTPVLIKGHLKEWGLFEKWDNAYLKRVAGTNPIRVTMAQEGIHFDKKTVAKMKQMPFDEYLDLLESGEAQAQALYAAQLLIPQWLPELVDDLAYPGYFERAACAAANLWYGPGQVSPLHYDSQNNFLTQIKGRKRVLLFPPEEIGKLYPHSAFSRTPHVSQINLTRSEFARYPKFAEAQSAEVWLAPGDMLYIPLFWWHGVFGYETNMSINYWYPPTPAEAKAHPRQLRRAHLLALHMRLRRLLGKWV